MILNNFLYDDIMRETAIKMLVTKKVYSKQVEMLYQKIHCFFGYYLNMTDTSTYVYEPRIMNSLIESLYKPHM